MHEPYFSEPMLRKTLHDIARNYGHWKLAEDATRKSIDEVFCTFPRYEQGKEMVEQFLKKFPKGDEICVNLKNFEHMPASLESALSYVVLSTQQKNELAPSIVAELMVLPQVSTFMNRHSSNKDLVDSYISAIGAVSCYTLNKSLVLKTTSLGRQFAGREITVEALMNVIHSTASITKDPELISEAMKLAVYYKGKKLDYVLMAVGNGLTYYKDDARKAGKTFREICGVANSAKGNKKLFFELMWTISAHYTRDLEESEMGDHPDDLVIMDLKNGTQGLPEHMQPPIVYTDQTFVKN